MNTNTASARRARQNPRKTRTYSAVRVYDMATGSLLRVTTARAEIARRLAQVDTAHTNGEMSARAHRLAVQNLARMERAARARDEWRTGAHDDDDAQALESVASVLRDTAHRDYDGVWDTRAFV